jgi:hypothetical protein
MVSSIVCDLRLSIRRRDILRGVNDGIGRLNFSKYLILVHQINGVLPRGCCKEDCLRNNLFRLLRPQRVIYLGFQRCWSVFLIVFSWNTGVDTLIMLFDDSTVCVAHATLALQLKMIREPSLVFIGMWLDIYVIVPWPFRLGRRKSLKTLKFYLFFLDFNF